MGKDLILEKDDMEIELGRTHRFFARDETEIDDNVTDEIDKKENVLFKELLKKFIALNKEDDKWIKEELMDEVGELTQEFGNECVRLGSLYIIQDLVVDGWTLKISQ